MLDFEFCHVKRCFKLKSQTIFFIENVVSGPPPGQYNGPPQPSPGPQMQQQRRVGRPIGPQQGYNNQGAGGYQQDQQQQNQGSKARFINPTIRANAI